MLPKKMKFFFIAFLTVLFLAGCSMGNQLDYHQLENATSEGNKKLVLECLRDGLDPSGQQEKKNAPILFAISNGHIGIVKILLDAGVDPNFSSVIVAVAGKNPLPNKATLAVTPPKKAETGKKGPNVPGGTRNAAKR